MQIEINPQSIFPRPPKQAYNVLPAHALQERLPWENLDGPVRNRHSDPVQTCSCYLGDVFFCDEGVVVIFKYG